EELCAAFQGPARLRNILVRTFLLAAFSGVTKDAIRSILLSHKLSLEAGAETGELPAEILEALPKIPLSLRTLERRLGVDTDTLLINFTICTSCGKRYSPAQIEDAREPGCTRVIGDDPCGNPLYTESLLYGDVRKRKPFKSFPYLPVAVALERFLMRPGIKELLQHWRGNDNVGDGPPLTQQNWNERQEPQAPFGDISQAWGWKAQHAGITRSYDLEDGTYGDDMPDGDPKSFQGFKNGKYSITGVYIIVNNLPPAIRTLPDNMILVMAMPGPKEPSAYGLDQILEPLVDDMIRLGEGEHLLLISDGADSLKGQEMLVHNMETGRPEPQRVHTNISAAIVDYIARIKLCGHAGVASQQNFCLYCTKKHCYISTGTRFTEFDRLPGWYGPTNAPIDGMHLFDLGLSPWICRNILVRPGLLHRRYLRQPDEFIPYKRFDNFIKRTVFPSHCSRQPPQIKAEQWRHLTRILCAALFEAWREDDSIPDLDIPRGTAKSLILQYQQRTAKLFWENLCNVHIAEGGDPEDKPKLEHCAQSRNVRDYYLNVLRYLVALSILSARNISREDLAFAQQLLARCAKEFTRMKVHLNPSFHYAMHVEESVLKFGALWNTSTAPFERANKQLI
ncbi:hypothetical protein BDV93DRAFT_403094, partial [Ceratobasidium sp. AG-I]